MTLEPVHIKEIHDLVSRIDSCLRKDDPENDDTDSVNDILKLLDELRYEGKTVLRAIGKVKRGKVSIERMLSSNDPFAISYACDSGSTTARTFDNGLYVDFCHCALASSPTDLGIHNMRTIVAATYTSSRKVTIDTSNSWELFDGGAGRKRIIRIQPGILNKKTNDMLHDIALYLCESEHLLWMLEKMQKESFLIMDGPIYPKRLMYWMVVASDEIQIRTDPHSEKVLQNYIDIMD
ncbi:MAG: nuclease, partial [Methanolobus sp.]|nr:nuclease [Methanolobus sp.]